MGTSFPRDGDDIEPSEDALRQQRRQEQQRVHIAPISQRRRFLRPDDVRREFERVGDEPAVVGHKGAR